MDRNVQSIDLPNSPSEMFGMFLHGVNVPFYTSDLETCSWTAQYVVDVYENDPSTLRSRDRHIERDRENELATSTLHETLKRSISMNC